MWRHEVDRSITIRIAMRFKGLKVERFKGFFAKAKRQTDKRVERFLIKHLLS